MTTEESAEKVAKATLFRRGNNFISDEILKKPFSILYKHLLKHSKDDIQYSKNDLI